MYSRYYFFLAVFFGTLLAYQSAFADTYNIILKKSGDKVSVDDGDSQDETAAAPVENKTPEPPPKAVEKTEPRTSDRIIINNNYTPPPSPISQPQTQPEPLQSVSVASPKEESETHVRMSMGVVGGNLHSLTKFNPGVSLNLGFQFTERIGVSLYGQIYKIQSYYAGTAWETENKLFVGGGELQAFPIGIKRNARDYDVFQLGPTLGTDSVTVGTSVPLHLGLRANLSPSHDLGFTAAVKTNGAFTVAEVGIMTRL